MRVVDRSLGATARQLKAAVSDLNRAAGKSLARGDYKTAEVTVELARSLMAFGEELSGLHMRWRALQAVQGGLRVEKKTPLWTVYVPVLQSLIVLGGEATTSQLRERLATVSGGRGPSLTQARRAMVDEGFLEKSSGKHWRITPAGHQAASAGPKEAP